MADNAPGSQQNADLNPSAADPGARRKTYRLLFWNGLFLALLLTLVWASSTYYYYFFFGPVPADDAALLELARHPDKRALLSYVELTDRTLIPTGWREVATVDGKPSYHNPYYLIAVGDRYLIVHGERDADGKRLIGPIGRMPLDVESQVVAEIVRERPELDGKFLPLMLRASAAFTVIGYVGLVLLTPLALLLTCNLGKGLARLSGPVESKLV